MKERMEETVRRELAQLFKEEQRPYISLKSLDKILSENEAYVSLESLGKPLLPEEDSCISLNARDTPLQAVDNEKDAPAAEGIVMKILRNSCEHLSQGVECNVGGFGSLRCLDESFHNACPFKQRHAYLSAKKTGKA